MPISAVSAVPVLVALVAGHGESLRPLNAAVSPVSGELSGYMIVGVDRAPEEFGAGFSL